MEIFAPGAVSFAQFIRRFSNSFYQDSRDLFFSLKTKKFSTGTCQPFSRKIFVTVNGKILPCERIGQNYSFGICTPDDVIIDNKYIVSLYNNSYRRLQSYCDKCYNNKECTECIFYIFDSNDHLNCNGFMSTLRCGINCTGFVDIFLIGTTSPINKFLRSSTKEEILSFAVNLIGITPRLSNIFNSFIKLIMSLS